jgi:hypothetical protein
MARFPLRSMGGYETRGMGAKVRHCPPTRLRYSNPMSPTTKQIMDRVASWPVEDQEELAEIAREIEARRTGVYKATADELRALDEAERSGIATDEEVEAAFRSFRRR